MRIVISSEFRSNILDIFNYISKDSIRYANETIKNLYIKINFLKEFPYIGRYVPEQTGKQFKELLYKNYRILYSISKDIILIYSIIHNKKNFKSNFNSNNLLQKFSMRKNPK
ncbi:MAG: type II toxin-antitoxin system RelE/ParE family toxin [Clostridiales bacterium]|nr:type II toxin-antitoxin system RelE/ParE family toxin [Clostridiales bacterium]